MNRNPSLRAFCWAAVVLWMALIFFFSSQPAAESSKTSSPFVRAYLSLVHPDFGSLSPEEQFTLEEEASFLIRKTAHFSIYTILGALSYSAVSVTLSGSEAKTRIPLSFLIGALYAVSDEIHQSFVPGRSCELRDMAIDSAGVLLGVLIASGIAALLRRKRRKEK